MPLVVAAAAAFLARWLVRRFAPEASGSGVQHIEAVVRGDARVTGAAVLPVKFFGGVLALGAGLALGDRPIYDALRMRDAARQKNKGGAAGRSTGRALGGGT